jgi:molybdopterin-containing oxidoreductase family iron-sulfur binding subunit
MHFLHEGQEWIRVNELQDASGKTYYLPVLCQQCEEPPCVNVCPVGATYKVADGVTVVDQDRCIGCRMCMAACPYDVRTFNWDDPLPADTALGKPSPEWPVPQQKGTVGKCVLCVHNIRDGKLPGCVDACNMDALYVGDLRTDLAANHKETVRLSDLLKNNELFRYKEELNTHPRIYYIPGHGQDSE